MNSKIKKTCVIMQPTYLPWVGYFDLIHRSDVFVFLNDVQFSKQSWQVKNKIISQGNELTLTVPIKKASLSTIIDQIIIDDSQPWRKKHLKSIYYSYIKTPFFEEVFPVIERVINNKSNCLADFNVEIIKILSNRIFEKSFFIDSRHLKIYSKDKLDRIIKICQEVGATDYLSPAGSVAYLESMNYEQRFSNASIKFSIQDYSPKKYTQLNQPFKPFLSIIDLLFNKGFEKAKTII